jgi:hypothetical protein
MRVDLIVHIVAGALGILSGFVALFVAKGNGVHRRSGMLFVYSMVIMGIVGAAIAVLRNVAPGANGPIGVLTAYLVVTGLTTVRSPSTGGRALDYSLFGVILAVTITLLSLGAAVVMSPTGKLYGMPPYPFLIFGAIALLAAIGDWRLIKRGGVRVIRGTPRIVRHLWRMTTALLIAAFSFFLGQAKVIPKPYRIFPLLLIPPLVVLGALLYWLWRVRVRRSVRGLAVRVSPPRRVEAALSR